MAVLVKLGADSEMCRSTMCPARANCQRNSASGRRSVAGQKYIALGKTEDGWFAFGGEDCRLFYPVNQLDLLAPVQKRRQRS